MNLLSAVLIVVFVAQVLGNPQGTYNNDRGNQGNNYNGGSHQQRPQQQQRPEYNSGYGSNSNLGPSDKTGSLGTTDITGAGYNQTGNGTDLDSRFGFFGGNHGSSGLTGLVQNLFNRPSSTGHHGSSNFFRPISNNENGGFNGHGQGHGTGHGHSHGHGSNNNGYYGNNGYGGYNGQDGYDSNTNGYYGNNGYGNNRNENSENNQDGNRNPLGPIREMASNIFGSRDTQNGEQSGGLFGSTPSSGSQFMSVLSGVANYASEALSNRN